MEGYSSFEPEQGHYEVEKRFGGRVRKRRGVKIRLLHRMKDSGKLATAIESAVPPYGGWIDSLSIHPQLLWYKFCVLLGLLPSTFRHAPSFSM